jgi:hypothetical protein
MNLKHLSATFAAVAALSFAAGVSAAPITPSFTSFGTLAGATFGGSGIPNTAVAITQTSGDLTLGLTAHQRCAGPNLVNDSAGRFTANAGFSAFGATCATPGPSTSLASWNFGTYIAGADVSDLMFRLFYDFDPAAGNDQSTHGSASFPGIAVGTTVAPQGSSNLGFAFLSVTDPMLGIMAPGVTFDPTVNGEYSFALVAYETNGTEVGRAAIVVDVTGGTNAVPTPGTLALVAAGLLGLAGASRRRRTRAKRQSRASTQSRSRSAAANPSQKRKSRYHILSPMPQTDHNP